MSPRILQTADVRAGDVLLCYSDQMVKEGDPYGSGYAHAAIALDDAGQLLEAAAPGVRLSDVSKLLNEYDHVAIMRADAVWDTPRLAALAKFASTAVGKRFNAVGMMKVPTRKAQLDNELLDRIEGHFAGTQPQVPSIRPVYFCSELVSSAFIEAGIVEQSAAVVLAPETISPDDIGKDKVFGFFVGYLVSHPAYNVPAVDPFKTRI